MLDRAASKTTELVALGEFVERVERVLDSDPRSERVVVAALLETVRDGYVGEHETETVTVDAPDIEVVADPAVLQVVVGALLENALEHAGDAPTVTLSAERRDGVVAVVVADDGPGLPDHERDVLSSGAESALQHGSGLGLWLANWGATTLGGNLTFETSDGTRATVTIPDRQ